MSEYGEIRAEAFSMISENYEPPGYQRTKAEEDYIEALKDFIRREVAEQLREQARALRTQRYTQH
jgi:hypothetical protein